MDMDYLIGILKVVGGIILFIAGWFIFIEIFDFIICLGSTSTACY